MSYESSDGEMDLTNRVVAALTGVNASSQGPDDSLEPETKKMKTAVTSRATVESQGNTSDWCAILREKLNRTRSILKAAASDAKKLIEKTADVSLKGYLHGLLVQTDEAHQTIDSLLSKKGNVLNLPKFGPPQTEDTSSQKVSTTDASTDMILTPGYWDSATVIESRAASARRRTRKPKVPSGQLPQEAEIDAAMETDTGDWSEVVSRRTAKNPTSAARQPTTGFRTRPPGFSKKPPAILIQNAAGKSYRDTILAVRNCGLTREEIGTSVTMRQTRGGCLLLELPKGSSSTKAAKTIALAMHSKLGDSVGKVVQLGVQVEVEVLDIDAAATASEVLEALRDAIPGQDDPAGKIDRDVVSDVRIWGTRSGQQIATAKMPRSIAASIARVPIGWTMCRVRPRTLPPERCFRCQAFGHNTRECKAVDRTGACWKCGVIGHAMKDCAEADDRCVACESVGLPRIPHKPGSGACAARKQSAGVKTGHNA